jgi:diguanylate cyclase (GGDEF)-like protein
VPQRLARLEGSPLTLARQRIFETRVFQSRGDADAARRAAEAGLAFARQGQSPRLEALLLANLSDIHVKNGRPRAALRAIERALPVVRRHADRRIELVLLHNAALARIALGQRDGARRVMEELLLSHASTGADGDRAVALREFSEAYAASGDHVAALALYHRERELVAEIMKRNREAALAELRSRFDRESQQRRLQLLSRQNTLMSQQIDNRKVMQKVGIAGAAAVALAMGLVALLYRRVHRLNRRLAHNHSVLREQSERDPLTGLANRRALYEKATQLDLRREFGGALLLVDIDHFKQVNDLHGHANGDLVLVAVAERLARAAGPRDLVVRWGGEEFLIFLPDGGLQQAQALALRVLECVGGDPVAVGAGTLCVTASVGYGSFPLPPARLPMNLERAINLADMALYTAKNQGRNRAVGIAAAQVADAAALAWLEQDFDQAWTQGHITLLQQPGPGAPDAASPGFGHIDEPSAGPQSLPHTTTA